jgi:hypothetical protein
MANTFKTLTNNDVASTRTLLHEAIPVTGTIVSGTYTNKAGSEFNIKNYSHGMFQSVYDYPYLSSSANQIFDITAGYSSNSALSASTSTQNSKKINMYNQMAQVLAGFDHTGSIRDFDQDGSYESGGTKFQECIFLNFARLLTKDEIKKGSFKLQLLTSSFTTTHPSGYDTANLLTIQDHNGITSYKTNSPAGEYGLLMTSSTADDGYAVGHVYYQAGIAVVTASVFSARPGKGTGGGGGQYCAFGSVVDFKKGGYEDADVGSGSSGIQASLTGSNLTGTCDGFRNRLYNMSFNNTTELNSTVYFCRANHNDFNYSSNPTYLSGSKIQVKNSSVDSPVSYITTVGLYSADNELLAVAKLSEPLKKTPETELTLRVRLDY